MQSIFPHQRRQLRKSWIKKTQTSTAKSEAFAEAAKRCEPPPYVLKIKLERHPWEYPLMAGGLHSQPVRHTTKGIYRHGSTV
jgi:hypothetical protein